MRELSRKLGNWTKHFPVVWMTWWQRYCTCKGLLTLIQRKSDVGITYRIQWRALLFWMVQVMSRLPFVLSLMYKKKKKHPYNSDDKRCDFFFGIPKNVLRFGQRCYWPAPPPSSPSMLLLIFQLPGSSPFGRSCAWGRERGGGANGKDKIPFRGDRVEDLSEGETPTKPGVLVISPPKLTPGSAEPKAESCFS